MRRLFTYGWLLLAAFLTTCVFAWCDSQSESPVDATRMAPPIERHPGPEYADTARMFQGIPTIERGGNGRLWAAWYGGGVTEDRHNYVMLATSGDNGRRWSPVKTVIDPDGDGPVRAFDPCLWRDPAGRLWLFWAQGIKMGSPRESAKAAHVFAIVAEEPDAEDPTWSKPRCIARGIALDKPTVLAGGSWLLPVAMWGDDGSARVIASGDHGATWKSLGKANVPRDNRNCEEHMIVERRDGSLWMLVRVRSGIGESFSHDGGKTWTDVAPTTLCRTVSRFHIRRLKSGNLLLVKHAPPDDSAARSHLTAVLSTDDGRTWSGGLVLDDGTGVSYPDAAEGPEGMLYVIYDYARYRDRQILLATFTEEDVLAKRPVSGRVRLRTLVNQATGKRHASPKAEP